MTDTIIHSLGTKKAIVSLIYKAEKVLQNFSETPLAISKPEVSNKTSLYNLALIKLLIANL